MMVGAGFQPGLFIFAAAKLGRAVLARSMSSEMPNGYVRRSVKKQPSALTLYTGGWLRIRLLLSALPKSAG
jgi:hypothetical protein